MRRVVAIGGGTGMPVLIRSLSGVADHIDAIVTAADDGGSSGRLRAELDGFPPGDSRNCLVAMAEDSVMAQLFQYRFERGEGLKSHALGNLIISALAEITGDFRTALSVAGELVGAKGMVMPPSLEPLTLYADVAPWSNRAGSSKAARVRGQCNVANRLRPLHSIGIEPANASACPEAIAAVERADIIILGPGSLFTSIIANLLVKELSVTIQRAGARKIFLCNTTVQRGETDGYSASDHLRAVRDFSGIQPDLLISSNTGISNGGQADTAGLAPLSVEVNEDEIGGLGVDYIAADLTASGSPTQHDPGKLARLWREIL